MEKQTKQERQHIIARQRSLTSYSILLGFIVLTLLVTWLLYGHVQDLFKGRLQERLTAIAATASVQFTPSELDQISGPESVGTKAYANIVDKLQQIRNQNINLKFIYILKKTEDPNTFKFVADADSIDPTAEIDLNQDGSIDESDALNTPGDDYDVSEYPELRDFGFVRSTVDPELAVDQWGTFLSASAPVPGSANGFQYLVGVDVEVSDFVKITNLAIVPFAFFVIFLLFVLTSQTVVLVKMWNARVEQLKELDRQKDELLSIVSHQLATPITSVKWYIEMMTSGDVGKITKEQKDHLNSVLSITSDLSDLVSMILDVSRIQLGRMRIEKKELDVNLFLKEILEVITPKAVERKVNFHVSLSEKIPQAMLDKRYTQMTIENLLSNAIKYTPEGGDVSFTVKLKGNMLYCEVKDTGCGIPKEEQSKIFGRMFRASNVRNSVDGNGFGLYVAKGAIEAQGGKIWFESAEGLGTTFFVEIPLKDA